VTAQPAEARITPNYIISYCFKWILHYAKTRQLSAVNEKTCGDESVTAGVLSYNLRGAFSALFLFFFFFFKEINKYKYVGVGIGVCVGK